jgi:hypothetical protein
MICATRRMVHLLLDPSPQTTQWAVIALGAITVIYIVIIRPMRQKKQKDPLDRSPTQTSLAQQRAVERDMSNLLVEYEQMIRKMTAHLDTRAAKLEILLKEADEKLAELASANGRAPSKRADEQADPSPAAADSEPDKRYAEIYKLADKGQSAKEIAKSINCPRGEVDLILALRGGKR